MFGLVFLKILFLITMVMFGVLSIAYVSEININLELYNLYHFIRKWICSYTILNCLKLMLQTIIVLLDIFLQYFVFIFYYFVLFLIALLDFLSVFNPILYNCISSILNFVSWSSIKIVQGIFLKSDCLTVFLSWILVICFSILYLDIKFWSGNDVERPPELDPNILTAVHPEQNLQPRNTTQDLIHGLRQLKRRVPNGTPRSRRRVLSSHFNHRTQTENGSTIRLRANGPHNTAQTNQGSESSESLDSDLDDNQLFGDTRENLHEATDYQPMETQNVSDCTICMLEIRNVAVFPCGHTQFCKSCVEKIMLSSKKCPICTLAIHDYRSIFL